MQTRNHLGEKANRTNVGGDRFLFGKQTACVPYPRTRRGGTVFEILKRVRETVLAVFHYLYPLRLACSLAWKFLPTAKMSLIFYVSQEISRLFKRYFPAPRQTAFDSFLLFIHLYSCLFLYMRYSEAHKSTFNRVCVRHLGTMKYYKVPKSDINKK